MTCLRPVRFSLLELIVVMALLTIAMAVLTPSLGGFCRGRRLDDEARRLWALTRHAQELAICRAVPVAVWVDPGTGRYGLESEPGYGDTVQALTYELGTDIEIATSPSLAAARGGERLRWVWWPDGSLVDGSLGAWQVRRRQDPDDAWTLTRDLPLSTFSLSREGRG